MNEPVINPTRPIPCAELLHIRPADPRLLRGRQRRHQSCPPAVATAAATAGGQDDQCQDCGVLVDQFHVPGCPQEQCPRCPDLLVECSCEIDVD